ncbi:hypothetical protein FRX31_003467 [Thalictrum thalictroides]|uniref:Uncharacterized protein n=1 Tax=Thalictrum thalictroides TaxID=46969 RepID=A0A7J6XB10_THATH|nr:hypothetical protein FRX31_003467 [Thalictrum thalictroides]
METSIRIRNRQFALVERKSFEFESCDSVRPSKAVTIVERTTKEHFELKLLRKEGSDGWVSNPKKMQFGETKSRRYHQDS